MIKLGVRLGGVAIGNIYGECSQRGTKAAVVRDRDDELNSYFLWLF